MLSQKSDIVLDCVTFIPFWRILMGKIAEQGLSVPRGRLYPRWEKIELRNGSFDHEPCLAGGDGRETFGIDDAVDVTLMRDVPLPIVLQYFESERLRLTAKVIRMLDGELDAIKGFAFTEVSGTTGFSKGERSCGNVSTYDGFERLVVFHFHECIGELGFFQHFGVDAWHGIFSVDVNHVVEEGATGPVGATCVGEAFAKFFEPITSDRARCGQAIEHGRHLEKPVAVGAGDGDHFFDPCFGCAVINDVVAA